MLNQTRKRLTTHISTKRYREKQKSQEKKQEKSIADETFTSISVSIVSAKPVTSLPVSSIPTELILSLPPTDVQSEHITPSCPLPEIKTKPIMSSLPSPSLQTVPVKGLIPSTPSLSTTLDIEFECFPSANESSSLLLKSPSNTRTLPTASTPNPAKIPLSDLSVITNASINFDPTICPPEKLKVGMQVAIAYEENYSFGEVISATYTTAEGDKVKIYGHEITKEGRLRLNKRKFSEQTVNIFHTNVKIEKTGENDGYNVKNEEEVKQRYDIYCKKWFQY